MKYKEFNDKKAHDCLHDVEPVEYHVASWVFNSIPDLVSLFALISIKWFIYYL